MKQAIWEEDLGTLDLCAGALNPQSVEHSSDNQWLRSICESIEEWADRDEGSDLFEQYLIVLDEPQAL